MIRGLLVLGLISQAYGVAYPGGTATNTAVTLYNFWNTDYATSETACITNNALATNAATKVSLTSTKYLPIGICIALKSTFRFNNLRGVAGCVANLGHYVFNTGTGSTETSNTCVPGAGEGVIATTGDNGTALSVKFAGATGLMTFYTDAACSAGTTAAGALKTDATAEDSNQVCLAGNNLTYHFGSVDIRLDTAAGNGITAAGPWVTLALYKNSVVTTGTAVCSSVTAEADGGLSHFMIGKCEVRGANSHIFKCTAGVITYEVHTASLTCAATTANTKSLAMASATAMCYTSKATVVAASDLVLGTSGADSWKLLGPAGAAMTAAQYLAVCPAPAVSSATTVAATAAAGLAAAALIL